MFQSPPAAALERRQSSGRTPLPGPSSILPAKMVGSHLVQFSGGILSQQFRHKTQVCVHGFEHPGY